MASLSPSSVAGNAEGEGAPGSSATEESPRIRSADAALLGSLALLWGSAYIFIRQGIVLGASPLLFAAVRYALSAAAFALLALVRRELLPSRKALLISAVVGGPFLIGFYGGLLYWGEQFTSGGYAAVLSSTAPILTVVAAYSLLPAERLGRGSLAGVALGFVGAIVLVYPELRGGFVGGWEGPLIILGAFLSTAVGSVVLRRIGLGRQGLWQIGTQFAVGGLVLGVAMALLPVPETLPLSEGVLTALALLVVLSSVMGYFVYFTLHHRVGPVRANVVAYLLPLVGLGLGTGFLGEAVNPWEVAGFLIVLAGVTLVLWESAKHPRHDPGR
ncbi:MAG: DMT family transporter [Thermoplasmata archaeon]|nr:DMT family transporter [Thermoplasmata archaeon]